MKSWVLVLLLPLNVMALNEPPLSESDEWNLHWATYNLPSTLPPSRIEGLLQHMVDATHGIGFRFIGDAKDFDHGHVLYEQRVLEGKPRLFPRAILYHTQEHAYSARWRTGVDPRYDYLEVTTRNWVQWLDGDLSIDGSRIVNAREYLDHSQKAPEPFFADRAAPVKGQHYTIHSHNLDESRLGFELHGSTQFRFHSMNCDGVLGSSEKGPIQVEVDREVHCLKLFTSGSRFVPDSTFRP